MRVAFFLRAKMRASELEPRLEPIPNIYFFFGKICSVRAIHSLLCRRADFLPHRCEVWVRGPAFPPPFSRKGKKPLNFPSTLFSPASQFFLAPPSFFEMSPPTPPALTYSTHTCAFLCVVLWLFYWFSPRLPSFKIINTNLSWSEGIHLEPYRMECLIPKFSLRLLLTGFFKENIHLSKTILLQQQFSCWMLRFIPFYMIVFL